MKTPKDAFGLNLTKHNGPTPCKGAVRSMEQPHARKTSPEQAVWLLANKPAYFTGRILEDLNHLPQHLRHV